MKTHVELSGGESVYCINEAQLEKAHELVLENGGKLGALLSDIRSTLSRNEQAALAFLIIDTLRKS